MFGKKNQAIHKILKKEKIWNHEKYWLKWFRKFKYNVSTNCNVYCNNENIKIIWIIFLLSAWIWMFRRVKIIVKDKTHKQMLSSKK